MRRRITKQLTCPGCGVIVATAVYQRWPGDLVLTSLEGHRLHPMGGGLQVRIAERRRSRRAAARTVSRPGPAWTSSSVTSAS